MIIFLTAAVVILGCAEVYVGKVSYLSAVTLYISVFLVPLFAFLVGIKTKDFAAADTFCLRNLGVLGMAFLLLKLLNCFIGVYVLGKSFIYTLLENDQSWVFIALVIWITAAWLMKGLKPAVTIAISAALGITVGFLPTGALSDILSKIVVFFPIFLVGRYIGVDKTAACINRRWVKVLAICVGVFVTCAVYITGASLYQYTSIFTGEVFAGAPVYKITARLIAYILGVFMAAIWLCIIPARSFSFTVSAKRGFTVFTLYWIIIKIWQHFHMNSIFSQIWAGHSILLFFISISVIMIFLAIIPMPILSNYIDRIYAGKLRLSETGYHGINRIKQYSFLFSELVKRDFKKKYKRTVLGMVWSVLSPLLTLLVMWLVFSQFFGRDTPHYVPYVFAGNLIFMYFSDSTSEGMNSLVGNANIFTKVNVPKFIFIYSKNISSLISFGLTLVIFFAFVAGDGLAFTWKFLLLLYPICCLVIFNIGVGLILSALYVFFKDIKYLWNVFTKLLLYMSAIFYSIDRFTPAVQNLFLLNPMYVYIRYFRKIVIEGTVPSLWFHLIALGYAVLFYYLGIRMYKKNNTKFLYYI